MFTVGACGKAMSGESLGNTESGFHNVQCKSMEGAITILCITDAHSGLVSADPDFNEAYSSAHGLSSVQGEVPKKMDTTTGTSLPSVCCSGKGPYTLSPNVVCNDSGMKILESPDGPDITIGKETIVGNTVIDKGNSPEHIEVTDVINVADTSKVPHHVVSDEPQGQKAKSHTFHDTHYVHSEDHKVMIGVIFHNTEHKKIPSEGLDGSREPAFTARKKGMFHSYSILKVNTAHGHGYGSVDENSIAEKHYLPPSMPAVITPPGMQPCSTLFEATQAGKSTIIQHSTTTTVINR